MTIDVGGVGINPAQQLLVSSQLQRFVPEPKNTNGITFGGVLRTAANVVAQAAGQVGISPDYQAFIEKQNALQKDMLLISFASNASKTRHETEMAAVRNMRVG